MKKLFQIVIPVLAVAATLNGVSEFHDYMEYAMWGNNVIEKDLHGSNARYYVDLQQEKHEQEVMEAYENMTPEQRMEGVVYE